MFKNPLIVFEGIEGSGKSTQIKNVTKFLNKKKINFIRFREPGGTKNSEKLRKLILSKNSNFNKLTDLYLYFASRSENYEKILKKNYRKKTIIIDRFIYSTIAYQAYGMKIDKKIIEMNNKYIIKDVKPDLIFLLLVNKKNFKKRIGLRKNKNRYDEFKYDFYKNVQNGYLKILKNNKKCVIINSNEDIETNKNKILKKIEELI